MRTGEMLGENPRRNFAITNLIESDQDLGYELERKTSARQTPTSRTLSPSCRREWCFSWLPDCANPLTASNLRRGRTFSLRLFPQLVAEAQETWIDTRLAYEDFVIRSLSCSETSVTLFSQFRGHGPKGWCLLCTFCFLPRSKWWGLGARFLPLAFRKNITNIFGSPWYYLYSLQRMDRYSQCCRRNVILDKTRK